MASIRQHAKSITGPHLSDMARDFRYEATAHNWMLVERAMKAHQMACIATDDEIETFLQDVEDRDIVDCLVILFDCRAAALERELEQGGIRLFKAVPLNCN